MTSDEFFKNNEIYFDCIFIDALHIYEQVRKDILNSIKFLNANGIIIILLSLTLNIYIWFF